MVKPLDNDKTDPGENLSERREDCQAPEGKITFTADQNQAHLWAWQAGIERERIGEIS